MNPQDDLLSGRRYLLDLSMVSSLDELNENRPVGSLLVPETLDHLLRSDPSPELARVLTEAIMPRDPSPVEREEFTISVDRLAAITEVYRFLAERGVTAVINNEEVPDSEFRGLLDSIDQEIDAAQGVTLQNGMFVTPKSLVRTHLTTILNFSKRTGTGILALGRSLVSRIRGQLPTLEFPDRVAAVVEKKQAFTNRWFSTRRVRAAKVIVGIVLGGLGLAHPAFGVLGFVFAFVDP